MMMTRMIRRVKRYRNPPSKPFSKSHRHQSHPTSPQQSPMKSWPTILTMSPTRMLMDKPISLTLTQRIHSKPHKIRRPQSIITLTRLETKPSSTMKTVSSETSSYVDSTIITEKFSPTDDDEEDFEDALDDDGKFFFPLTPQTIKKIIH